MNRTISKKLFEEAKRYFPGGVNSPVRAFKSVYGPPLFMAKGDGCRMTDEDGNTFFDMCSSWGPLILGHNNALIRDAIIDTVTKGTSFGTPTMLGNMLGQLILDNHRFIEKMRFVSSGTEAVMSAIRLARGVTGRSKIIKFEGCYHGHVDSLMVKAGSGLATFGVSTSAGIPQSFVQDTIVLPLDSPQHLDAAFRQYKNQIAAVIIEPVPANNGLLLQQKSFLECIRLKCHQNKALLIFDEVISGFRLGFEGAAGMYQIQPDIMTFGKIIGGGMPVGAYAASAKIMDNVAPEGTVYQAGTLSANPVTMAAGYAALKQLLAPDFYENLERKTTDFVDILQEHISEKDYPVDVVHMGSIFWIKFTKNPILRADQIDPASMDTFKELHKLLLDAGVYLGPSGYEVGFVSAAHTEEDLKTIAGLINESLDKIF